jgi:FkbM family methyltransferase
VRKMLTTLKEYARVAKNAIMRHRYRKLDQYTLEVDGIRVVYSTADWFSNWTFYPDYLKKPSEPTMTKLLVDMLRDCRCFADVGANFGYFTCIAVVANREIPVYAFELDHEVASLARHNAEINGGKDRVTVVAGAVGDDNLPIKYVPHGSSFLAKLAGVERIDPFSFPLVSAPKIRLDDYFSGLTVKPDLFKIDVEGHEAAVLRGMGTLLDQPDLKLLIEVHPMYLPGLGSSVEEVLGMLRERGLEVFYAPDFRDRTVPKLIPVDLDLINAEAHGALILATRSTNPVA